MKKRIRNAGVKYAGVPVFSRAFLLYLRTLTRANFQHLSTKQSVKHIVDAHFSKWSIANHPTRKGFEIALESSSALNLIVETGTSAWGCDSSRLFDSIVRFTKGTFLSVDIRAEASEWLKHQTSKSKTRFFIEDSTTFLSQTLPKMVSNKKIDLLYLDSFDLDFQDPAPSELHCLKEFEAALPLCREGTIIIIDDTCASVSEFPEQIKSLAVQYHQRTGRLPGKGSLVLQRIKGDPRFEVLWHQVNLVIKCHSQDVHL